ncbi:MAG TPA: sigma 54-interacting transcriptional regulator [Planctomycetota bacterium]|nr:sigma 54-interacting transcriptional regulator [Planctomycetota bacterium]
MSPLILRDTAEGTLKFPLADASLTLGRAADCGIRIDDRSLSAHHCRFDPVPGGWKVVDLTSRNGTFVNDVLVAQKRLDDGDRLRAGRVLFRYVVDDETVDEEAAVEALVDRVHRRAGHAGLRRAAGAFASASEKVGLPGLLPGADEVAGAARLRSVAAAMVSERSERALYDQIVDALIDLTGAERGFLILAETEGGTERRVVAARNFDREAVRDAMAKVSKTVERQAFDTGNPVVVTDATMDERFSGTQSVLNLRLRSILCVAVRGREGPIGTIYLDNRFERGVFEERQLPLIRAFADQAALAVENARLHEENERRLADLERANAEVEELNRILSDRVAKASVELQEIKEHVLRERAEAPLKYSYANIVGSSRPMQDLFHLLDKVTDSDVPVLIQGESGTGKELVARAIHFNGPRADRPFVSENCAAIPETLLESELFGYARGAFTGATADRKGLFENAAGGTIFLDEIGDMPMEMQKKLLRVLQEKEVRPVGGKRTILVDVRVLSASNQDLRRLVAEGRFREDLYYRLNVITVELPPLRERAEDVPLLVDRFLDEIAGAGNVPRKAITEDARMLLQRYAWPGNVRELRNEIQKAHALSDKVILPMVLSEPIRRALSTPTPVPALGEKPLKELVREVVDDLERRAILEALRRTRGRKAQAARMLGVSRPTLDAKIDLLHIPVPKGAE